MFSIQYISILMFLQNKYFSSNWKWNIYHKKHANCSQLSQLNSNNSETVFNLHTFYILKLYQKR